MRMKCKYEQNINIIVVIKVSNYLVSFNLLIIVYLLPLCISCYWNTVLYSWLKVILQLIFDGRHFKENFWLRHLFEKLITTWHFDFVKAHHLSYEKLMKSSTYCQGCDSENEEIKKSSFQILDIGFYCVINIEILNIWSSL